MAVTWNANYELTPLGQDSPTGADDEIRLLKDSISKRMANEHETFETDNSSGAEGDDFVHKAGSAKIYYQADAPTLRPDGVTSLDSEDNGRLWVDSDDNTLYTWVDTEWVSQNDFGSATTFGSTVIFEGDVTFSGNATQAWGKVGIPYRPAMTAGSNIAHRSDTAVDGGDYEPVTLNTWFTLKTLTWVKTIADNSVVNIYVEHEGDNLDSYDVRILVNGAQVAIDVDEAHNDYSGTTFSNITLDAGDVISVQLRGTNIDSFNPFGLKARNLRVLTAENPNTWEKAMLGLTG